MRVAAAGRLTVDDLGTFPAGSLQAELVDGQLFVSPTLRAGHEDIIVALVEWLWPAARTTGRHVVTCPFAFALSSNDLLRPDVALVSAEHRDATSQQPVRTPPDLAVEVSHPASVRLDLVHKRQAYDRHGVAEYWFVDLDAERIEVYARGERDFAAPVLLSRRARLESPLLPGFTVMVEQIIQPLAR